MKQGVFLKTGGKQFKVLMKTDCKTVREDIVRMIIHEIRNPLSAISLANQLLRDEITDENMQEEAIKELTVVITRNVGRIEKQLLQLANVDTAMGPAFAPVNVCELLDDIITMVKDRVDLQKVTIHKLYGKFCHIIGNGQKLSMAFLNLVVNAIEAVEPGKGELWISIEDKAQEMEIIFRDNGKGMEPGAQLQLFKPNFTTKTKGLGIGLTHVRAILEEHHATIQVKTQINKGTSFIINFKK